MSAIDFVERDMTDAEFARMNVGFEEHTREQHNPVEIAERHGFVVMDGETFIGCASGLCYKAGNVYNDWFTLTDLFIEKPYRRQGLGAIILAKLEAKVAALGAIKIWVWTAGYEAPGFYIKQGYEVACEQENYYASGQGRVALRKRLEQAPEPVLRKET